jgi:hypothetical protein
VYLGPEYGRISLLLLMATNYIMKLLKKAPIAVLPTLKEIYKFNDKLEVTTKGYFFDRRAPWEFTTETNLYIVQKVNIKTLHVVDNKGDIYVMNPDERNTTVRIVR